MTSDFKHKVKMARRELEAQKMSGPYKLVISPAYAKSVGVRHRQSVKGVRVIVSDQCPNANMYMGKP